MRSSRPAQPTLAPGSPLEPLEIAAGLTLEPAVLPTVPKPIRQGPSARAALEAAILPALVAGGASVSFSGGRDSSLVLAVAMHVARREQLDPPVAITMRHEDGATQEAEWQELVLSHLGVDDWVRVDVGASMDVVGTEPAALLERVGVQSPPNAYLHLPVVGAAPVGTVLTGIGGDEMLSATYHRLQQVVFNRARPRPRDLLQLGLAAAPTALRTRVLRRRTLPDTPWLTGVARAELVDRLVDYDAKWRLRWDREARAYARSRSVVKGHQALAALGADRGITVAAPLLSVPFVEALARDVGPAGPRSRTDSMRLVAGDLLPLEVLARSTKAHFGAMVWGPEFRSFIAAWDPLTLDPRVARLVDVDRLMEQWSLDDPWFGTMMLAQQAWLDQRRGSRPPTPAC